MVKTPLERFMSFVNVQGDCWLWTGGKTEAGYPQFHFEGQKVYAHRWAHEYWIGSVEDLTVDHVWSRGCTSRSCVNPAHLQAVPLKVNILRGNGWAAKNARKTHCKRGHEFTLENTARWNGGNRTCRQCQRERQRAGS